MKLRTVLFLSAFLMAVGANFAFTDRQDVFGYYNSGGLCFEGDLDQTNCTSLDVGPHCTIFNPYAGKHVPAYQEQETAYVCLGSLYYR